jgi:hypothetical protein
MFNKKPLATAAAASLLCLAASAQAALIIDLDGLGGAGTIVKADVFDWLPGNAISVGGQLDPAPNFLDSYSFTTYSQANLSTLVLGGIVQATPNWSYVSGGGETATVTGINSISLFHDATNPVNFFEIWAGGAVGNDLLGTGFNDGVLILSGSITDVTGSFNLQLNPDLSLADPVLMDQFGADNWGGQLTQAGTGASIIDVAIGYLNPDYFLNSISGLKTVFQTQQNLPFTSANPAECFVTQAGGGDQCDGVFDLASDTAAGLGGYNPVLGPVNALNCPQGTDTCDILFLADASSSFIPEPTTLALLGAGLVGFGAMRRRKKQ